jgi:hypothetical protein
VSLMLGLLSAMFRGSLGWSQCIGRFLGIISRYSSASKCNWLHVVIYSIDSSEMMGSFPEVLNFNWLFLKLNCFICN